MLLIRNFKIQLLILSGLAYKLRSGALWRRWHSGVQNDANAPRTEAAQSHEQNAGHEGTYRAADLAGSTPAHCSTTLHQLHTFTLTSFNNFSALMNICINTDKFNPLFNILHSSGFLCLNCFWRVVWLLW